ncbi:MAG: MarR family winged helix-turn-helix transcriptional regulator [Gemmatimonadaceae bacterium]
MRTPSAARNEVVADRLHSAAIHLLRSLRRVDSASGLTAPRLSILSVLVFGGPRTLGELAEVEQVRPPTMTRLVAGLEEGRLVRRETDRNDRRVTRVHATAKGKKLMLAGRARRVADLAARLHRATTKELRELEHAASVIERLAIS